VVWCSIILERGLSLVAHGDDFTFCGVDEDLQWTRGRMQSWYDIKLRGILGDGKGEVKEVTILSRILRITKRGVEYEVDPKHRLAILDYFGFGENT